MDPNEGAVHPTSALSCRGLAKSFGPVNALEDLDLEVPRGTLLGLLGPNGAGKTTLIRILLGLTPMTSGRAFVLGEPVPSRAILPAIGYMPQSLGVYTDLKVRQNLELFGRLQGLKRQELRQHISVSLELVHLAERSESRVSELSGGMQRRVSLAAALLANPELLLLDEPTVGVDPELRSEFWEYFRQLARAGKTVVMTTHYMEEATRCDRVVMLHAGRLLEDDPPEAIKAKTGTSSMDDAFLVVLRERAKEADRSPREA
jgi:ABC-2 type transport system ATP-binding protein